MYDFGKKFFLGLAFSLLSACSSFALYDFNPESKEHDYMRILGDLRWDELTTKEQWMERFQGCLTLYDSLTHRLYREDNSKCAHFYAFNIPIKINSVYFSTSGFSSQPTTNFIRMEFLNKSQGRLFEIEIDRRFDFSIDGYCSRYTCWGVNTGREVDASPTPHALSLLDKVSIDISDL